MDWEIFAAIVTIVIAVSTIIGFMWTMHADNKRDFRAAVDRYNKSTAISDARWEALLERWHIHDKALDKLTYKNMAEQEK